MRRITGTNLYSFAKCPRLAALDLSIDKKERREWHPWEEFSAKRGRDFEERYVATLGAEQPEYPERDFDAGARATLALMRQGVEWIHQGVLLGERRLGLPDLLHKVDGESAIGSHHYEVIDVKTSGRARGDQVLQVMFYTRLLAGVQQRMPERGGVLLKTEQTHMFAVADYQAIAADVESRVLALADDPSLARPFLQRGCETCHWSERCRGELEAKDDLSLVFGMSHGARAILEANGCDTPVELAKRHGDARLSHQIDPSLLRRLRKAAQAHVDGAPLMETRPRLPKNAPSIDDAAFVHMLMDPYADRVLAFAVRRPGGGGEESQIDVVLPKSRDEEWPALRGLLAAVPSGAPLLHFDSTLPRWYEAHSYEREAEVGLSSRFLDLRRRLLAAAVMPAPLFALSDFVRVLLRREPLRHGHAGEAAMWAEAGLDERLAQKARADIEDLLDLKRRILDAAPALAQTI